MIRAQGLVFAALLVSTQLSGAQAPPQAPPRGWSITLGDEHVPARPASVKLGERALPVFEAAGQDRAAREKVRSDFAAAPEGWYFDAADRSGVAHIKIKPQALSAGFVVKVGM